MAHKAFVSSTQLDLKDHRAHVIRTLRRGGIHVDPMEDWPADAAEPTEFSRARLEGCSLCILLVAFRRGFVPPGGEKSITQLEYEAAVAAGIDVLVYMLEEHEPWPRDFDELDRDAAMRPWRAHLETRHGRELFGLKPESIDLTPALTRWLARQKGSPEGAPPAGWLEKHLSDLHDALATVTVPLGGAGRPRVLPLERVYVPLKLRIQRSGGEVEEPTWVSLLRRERVALTGDAGSGKSTLLRYIALQAASRLSRGLGRADVSPSPSAGPHAPGTATGAAANGEARIPIFLDLASTSGDLLGRTDSGGAPSEIPPHCWLPFLGARLGLTEAQVASVLGAGNVLLLLDGLDELPDPYDRELMVDAIARMQRHFSPLHSQNHVIVACREPAWGPEEAFARFEKAVIQPMDRGTIREFLARWSREVWGGAEGQAILACLERALGSSALGDVASNPQMSTLLTLVEYSQDTPRQQALLFEHFVRNLARSGRRAKEQKAMRAHLMALAVEMQRSTAGTGEPLNAIRIQRAEQILGRRALRDALPAPSAMEVSERGAALLARLEVRTGLLSIDRAEGLMRNRGLVRFRHRTFQEYLAACHYAEQGLEELLEHAVDPAWAKVMAFTCGILTQVDEGAVRELLERVLETPPSANGGELPPDTLVAWAPRVAAASACLVELVTYDLEADTLAPARRAHDLILPLLAEPAAPVDVPTRVRIAEGLGSIFDPRLAREARWVTVPAGPFVRGSELEEAWSQERPRAMATLGEFAIMRWPVTVAEYRRFLEDADGYAADELWTEEGRRWRDDRGMTAPAGWQQIRSRGNRPITGVSWWEARAFCRWWATVDPTLPAGWRVDLPTEAQWEKAARGGVNASGATVEGDGPERRFPWGDEWADGLANCAATGIVAVAPVGLFPAGHSEPYRLWDMAGNVSERCLDGFGPYAPPGGHDPLASDYAHGHVVRGGSFASPPLDLRLTYRFGSTRGDQDETIGFRCVAYPAASAPGEGDVP